MGKLIHLIDRSRVEAREDCPRLRFLNYDFDQTGIEPEAQALPLLSGIAIHSAHARLLAGEPLETVLIDVLTKYREEIALKGLLNLDVTPTVIREQSALLEGMLRMWHAVRMPMILEEYDVVSIEKTFDWELAPGLVERLRFDVLLRRKDDGLLFILDYKTVGYPSEVWAEKFEHNLQTCLYLQALKETVAHDEVVGGILYEGLVKGQYRKDTAKASPFFGQKVQQSPYTLAYKLPGDAGMHIYQTDYIARKGWTKVRPFEEMSMKEWVEGWLLPGGEGIPPRTDHFIVLPMILPPDYELQRIKQQVIREELLYHDQLERYRDLGANLQHLGLLPVLDEMLDTFAPLRTNRCYKFGQDHKCKYTTVCFNQGANPLEDGGFIRRVPHHDTDMEMVQ